MRFLHIVPSDGNFLSPLGVKLTTVVSALFVAVLPPAIAAPSVGVGSAVNCPGAYLLAGSGKVCQASPDYKDIIYLGENSRKSCKFPYTRVNAGDSKWCVTYPDP
jgi:hypothetical protein